MDLREKKTKRNIKNAFLELRSKKALEKITVKELSERAEISKATFYLHYRDIYDLSEQLQNEIIQNILAGIEHPEYCLSDRKEFTRELFYAFYAEQSLIETLFSGSQKAILPSRIESEIRRFVKKMWPDIDIHTEMLLTYTINGAYYVYQEYYKKRPSEDIIRLVSHATNSVFEP